MWEISLAWAHPHREPPPGQPRVLLAVEADRPHPIPDEIEEAWAALHSPAKGYAVHVRHIPNHDRPPVRWSEATKQRVRRVRLWRRLLATAPLIAPEEFARIVGSDAERWGSAPPTPPELPAPRQRVPSFEPSRVRKARMKRERRAAEQAVAIAARWKRQPVPSTPPAPFAPGTLFNP